MTNARHADVTPIETSRPKRAKGPEARRSGTRKDVLASEVLDHAAALFAERGYAGTSLKDVADAVGLSRPAIYYYFPSKEALLEELVEGVTLSAARIFDRVEERADLTPLNKVREAARQLVIWVTERRLHFKMVDRSEHELTESIAKRHHEAKQRVLGGMTSLVAAAIDSGEARPVDERTGAFAIIGMCNWTAWWFRPEIDGPAEEVAERLAGLAVASLQRSQGDGRQVLDIPALTQEVREYLDLIDRVSGDLGRASD